MNMIHMYFIILIQFMLFAQKYVPVNWGELRCNNVSSKILGTRSNDLILQKVSQLQFIYMNEENLDKAKLAATLYQNYREGYLNHERSLNDIDDVEFEGMILLIILFIIIIIVVICGILYIR
uniref:SJCHGC06916 protein n=1 Tax=Schistosoma japonicum TaxID=6182 RepID=Q5DGH2_SCHJA|nr:SJCHGC06916 protein [Schistosoma japonicum]